MNHIYIKKKKVTTNPTTDGDKYFQYAATVISNHEGMGKNLQKISKINKYSLKGKNYPSGKDDWKTFEKNNLTIALYVIC